MSSGDCQISMIWNWYTIDACFLSTSWHITNNGMFAATCIGVILMVVALEFLRRLGKEYDALILRQFQRHVAAQESRAAAKKEAPEPVSCCAPPPDDDEVEAAKPGPRTITFRATPLQQLIRSVIHAVTFGLAYIVMLLAMYFNGYIIISIIIGSGIGKFVCDWMVLKVVVGLDESRDGVAGIEEPTVCCG